MMRLEIFHLSTLPFFFAPLPHAHNKKKRMDPEAQYQTEQEQAQLETYDGPIDPATEQAIQELTDAGSKAFVFQDYELAVEKFGLASEML